MRGAESALKQQEAFGVASGDVSAPPLQLSVLVWILFGIQLDGSLGGSPATPPRLPKCESRAERRTRSLLTMTTDTQPGGGSIQGPHVRACTQSDMKAARQGCQPKQMNYLSKTHTADWQHIHSWGIINSPSISRPWHCLPTGPQERAHS